MEALTQTENRINQVNESIPETPKTMLTESNLLSLKRMFSDKASYEEYLQTLSILRTLVSDNIQVIKGDGISYDTTNPQFPAFKLLNALIGAIFQTGYYFDCEGKLLHNSNNQYVRK